MTPQISWIALIAVSAGVPTPPTDPARADEDLTAAFRREYLEHVPVLLERYVHNRRLRATDRRYRAARETSPDGQPGSFFEARVTSVADGEQIKVLWGDVKDEEPSIWLIVRPDEFIEVKWNEDRTGHVLSDRQDSLGGDNQRYEEARCLSGLVLPMLANNAYTFPGWFRFQDRYPRFPSMEVLSMTPSTLDGRPVVEVRMRSRDAFGPWLMTRYFDNEHDWIICRSVFEAEPELTEKYPGRYDYRIKLNVEYEDSPEGYPLPKRFTRDLVYADGTRRHERVIDIHEYARYEPKPEDFSLAGFRFTEPDSGAPEPADAEGPRDEGEPPGAGRPAGFDWALVAFAGAAALLGLFLFWRSRRPADVPSRG